LKIVFQEAGKMGKDPTDKMDAAMRYYAKYLAIVIRNAMEDFYHKYLSDEQMKELNPMIRNAIYTALYANENQDRSSRAKEYVRYHSSMIPKYWEEPQLLGGF
jgi:hypothetical protein